MAVPLGIVYGCMPTLRRHMVRVFAPASGKAGSRRRLKFKQTRAENM